MVQTIRKISRAEQSQFSQIMKSKTKIREDHFKEEMFQSPAEQDQSRMCTEWSDSIYRITRCRKGKKESSDSFHDEEDKQRDEEAVDHDSSNI